MLPKRKRKRIASGDTWVHTGSRSRVPGIDSLAYLRLDCARGCCERHLISHLYTACLMSDLAAIAYCANIILHSGRLSRPMRAGPDGGRWMGQDAPLEGAPSPCCPLPFLGWGASTMRATISISARPGLLARCLVCVHHVEPYCFITIKAAPILFPLFIFTSALAPPQSSGDSARFSNACIVS